MYEGERVLFYKRAQICVADLAGSFGGEGWGRFHDLDPLTAFADYKVPQVLRRLGILRYDARRWPDRSNALEPIPAGSEPEVEIRAATDLGRRTAPRGARAPRRAAHGEPGRLPPLGAGTDTLGR